ncbi:phosphatidylethanolamine N-methyltransferase, partial [Coemansia brasiliensis]
MCNFMFNSYVETPHMEKIYGTQVHRDSGIVRTVKKAVNKGIGQSVFVDEVAYSITGSRDVLDKQSDSSSVVGLLASTTKPVKDMLLETKGLLSTTTARLAEKALPSEISKLDCLETYSLKLVPGAAWQSNKKNATNKTMYYLGEPIRVAWQAPMSHSRRDWIGIYPVTANFSSQITTSSSKGCYVYIHPDENLLAEMVAGDSIFASTVTGITKANGSGVLYGSALFSSSALPFKVGTYELRLHHGGTHAVLAQSKPFDITTCATADIVNLLYKEDSSPESALSAETVTDNDDLEQLSLALLTVANKTFAVTDSHI